MSLTGSTNEQKIWNYLLPQFSNNPYGVAGMMGNMYAESALSPINLQQTYEKKLGFTDQSYTDAVDSGKYTNFARDSAGYGTCQWTYGSRKEALLNYARSKGVSIGDLEMQLEFLIIELKKYGLLTKMQTVKSVKEASTIILQQFEKPSSMNQESTINLRANYSQGYFDKYAKTSSNTVATPAASGKSSAAAVIAVAVAQIGYLEKKTNSQLDNPTANAGSANWTKYARDFDEKFPNWYNGKKNGYAWCDMFVDWCFLTAFGYQEALRLLCQPEKSAGAGCTYSLKYYKDKGQFFTSNPKPGDQIFFGTSLSSSSHTGLVEKVDATKVYTIEGNTSDRVARRTYALTDKTILGYGRPAYGTTSSASAAETNSQGGSKMSNSSLVSYTKISPNRTSPRNHVIDRVTIHCVVGQCSVETLGAIFTPTSKQASCNYGVGSDGRIALICEEKDRSWCTSSGANDHRAITIEVASDTKHPYAVNDKAYEATIKLVADICRRNGKKRITWLADKEKSINYAPAADEMLMTVHRWFANKACPGDYLYKKHGEIAARVNALLGAPAQTTQQPVQTTTPKPTTPVTNKKVTATKAAQEKDTSLAGTYTVTAKDGLNMRNGAGTQFASLVVIPYGTKVSNYGYYTVSNKVKWLYIQVVLNGITYTGFSSINYLKK